VLIVAPDQSNAEHLRGEVEVVLRSRTIETRYRRIDPRDETSLQQAMEAERGGILVVGGRSTSRRLETLESLAREIGTPLLFLDGR
jgi:hypothetical protein